MVTWSQRHWALFSVLGFVTCSSWAIEQFSLRCEIPYKRIATQAFEGCPARGSSTKARYKAQNKAKNNLCATGRPIPLSFSAFTRLQKAVDDKKAAGEIPRGLPEDRSVFEKLVSRNRKKIGEGTVVQYVGFIRDARYAGKESVNCKEGGQNKVDIHIDVLRSRGEHVCRSITVEVIPHFRPELWDVDHLQRIQNPVRFTGQLFYDASHTPCKNDNDTVSLKRASNWEIHPVYAIDVCRSRQLSLCSATKRTMWVPLDGWVNSSDADEEEEH